VVGRPNVGKSTIFNRFVGKRQAIVEDRARTTRDRMYGDMEWNGRRVVIGYGGWLWTYGLADWISKTDSVQRMLRGDPATSALLRQYHVDYVVVGPQEQALGANPAYWQTAARQVYSNGAYTVYRVG